MKVMTTATEKQDRIDRINQINSSGGVALSNCIRWSRPNEIRVQTPQTIYLDTNSSECITSSSRIVHYLDIDDKAKSVTLNEVLDQLDKFITTVLKQTDYKIFTLDASDDDKTSFHLIIRGIGHTSVLLAKEFARSFKDFSKIEAVDLNCYHSTQLFRIPYSSKNGVRRLIPVNENGQVIRPNTEEMKLYYVTQCFETKEANYFTQPIKKIKNCTQTMTKDPITELLDTIDDESYDTWMKVGTILKNFATIDYFHYFSKKSDKYNEDEVNKKWLEIESDKYHIGSLLKISKASNLEDLKQRLAKITPVEIDQVDPAVLCCDIGSYISLLGLMPKTTTLDFLTNLFINRLKVSSTGQVFAYSAGRIWKPLTELDLAKLVKTNATALLIRGVSMQKKIDNLEELSRDEFGKKKKTLKIMKSLMAWIDAKEKLPLSCLKLKSDLDTAQEKRGYLSFYNYDLELETGKKILRLPTTAPSFFHLKNEPSGSSKQMEDFVSQLVEPDTVEYMKRIFGYIFTGLCNEKLFIILSNEIGNNGKSALISTITHALTEYCTTSQISSILRRKDESGAREDLTRLQYKRFVALSEADLSQCLDTSVVKNITGIDDITCRGLYQTKSVTYRPEFTMMLATNTIPYVPNDQALFNRVKIINFPYCFVDEPKRPFERKVNRNLKIDPGSVLTYIIEGARDYYKYGLVQTPESIKKSIEIVKGDADVKSIFMEELHDCIVYGDQYEVSASRLLSVYNEWRVKREFAKISYRKLRQEFKEFTPIHRKKGTFYSGFKIGIQED